MWTYSLAKSVLITGVVLVAASGFAQPATQEQPVTRTAQDPQLQWGPCPAFMPAGCGLSVLHGDPAKPNADVFLRIPANAVIADHWQRRPSACYWWPASSSSAIRGRPRSCSGQGLRVTRPAKLSHTASCRGSTPCVLFIAFESAVDAEPVSRPPVKKVTRPAGLEPATSWFMAQLFLRVTAPASRQAVERRRVCRS